MAAELEILDIFEEDGAGIAELFGEEEWWNEIDFGVEAEEAQVNTFRETVLNTANSLKNWTVNALKGLTIEKVVMLGTGILMVYELISKHASAAGESGKRVKLSDAINGVKNVLVQEHQKNVANAQAEKNDPAKWNALSKDVQDALNTLIALDGETYWLTISDEMMTTLAKMPIYDPS